MKICTSENEYIEAIAPAVQRACKRYGYLPSVLIAQSCLENGYGIRDYWDNPQIEALLNVNNMVGIKSSLLNSSWDRYTVWPGDSIEKKTPEEYGGKMVTITDDFRKYDNIEQSFADFLLFITYASNEGAGGRPKYGPEVLKIKDPETLIKTVAGRGYATGSTYPTSVMRILNKHGLTKYDDLAKVAPTAYTPGRKTVEGAEKKEEKTEKTTRVKIGARKIIDITARNRGQVPRSRGENKIKFIVIHYLGVPNADNPDLYGGGYGGHYNITRAGSIYKAADPKTAVVWHCGGGLQGSGGHKYYGVCTNFNSIGIECGVCYTDTSVKDASGDSGLWYFTTETQQSLVYLVSKLMDEYGISEDHVIRHYDVTGKICPNPYVKNNRLRTSWTWDEFKNRLNEYRKTGYITIEGTAAEEKTVIKSNDLKKGDTGDAVEDMQTMLIYCGYSCGRWGADGSYGQATAEAVMKFQHDHKIAMTGTYNAATKKALTSLYKKKRTPKKTWKAIGTATATKDNLNVRGGPGTQYRIIRKLNHGNRFEIDGVTKGKWTHAKVVDQIGWIYTEYIKRD